MDVYNIQQDVISPFRETYLSAVLTELSAVLTDLSACMALAARCALSWELRTWHPPPSRSQRSGKGRAHSSAGSLSRISSCIRLLYNLHI